MWLIQFPNKTLYCMQIETQNSLLKLQKVLIVLLLLKLHVFLPPIPQQVILKPMKHQPQKLSLQMFNMKQKQSLVIILTLCSINFINLFQTHKQLQQQKVQAGGEKEEEGHPRTVMTMIIIQMMMTMIFMLSWHSRMTNKKMVIIFW